MSLNNVAVGLDIGTTKVTALIGKINNDRTVRYLGIGECAAMGLQKGRIVDINNSVQAIEQALSAASKMAGVKIDSVYVNTVSDPEEGMSNEAIANLYKSLNRIGIDINEMVLGPVAAAEAALNNDEKEKGALLVDIGGGTTGYAAFGRGRLRKAGVIPVGGGHITADLAFGLRVELADAEQIKITQGEVLPGVSAEYNFIEIGEAASKRKVSRKFLAEIIQPRVEEILSLVKKEISGSFYPEERPIVILTGGTSLLPGLQELASKIFGWQSVLAHNEEIKRAAHIINRPTYTTGIGLVRYGARNYRPQSGLLNKTAEEGLWQKLRIWIREYI